MPDGQPEPQGGEAAKDDKQGASKGGQAATAPDLIRSAQSLIEKHGGDALATIVKLLDEAHDLREERRTLRTKVPPEGAVVLTGDDATAWPAYTALGKAADLATALEAGKTATAKLAEIDARATLTEAAGLAGLKPEPLAKLLKVHGMAVTVEDRAVEGEAGKTERVALVKPTEGEGEAKPLADYAQTDLADFLPALKADGGDTKTTATPDATKATASQAAQPVSAPVGTIVFPEQGGTRGKAPGPVSAEQLAKEKASSGLYRF